jgi:threonyl-tRNA synthetase
MRLTTDKPWSINEGDGAFYGPKIDVLVRDNAGKQHQAATIQLDFQLPRNFDLKYDSENGEQRPVMIHRAIFGSLERFIALLIDHYQGKWPFWLNPRQAVVIPVAERHNDYAQQVVDRIAGTQNDECGLAAQLDRRFYSVDLMAQAEPVSVRIKRAVDLSYSFIILVGDREVEASTVALRSRGSRATETRSIDDVRPLFHSLEVAYK